MDRKLLTLGMALAGTAVQAQERPNIVLFLVDDMGVMDTSVPFLTDGKGNPVRYPLNDWYRTPNMERLADQGVRFSQFYAQGVSSPSRTSLLTGQDAARHRVTNWIRSEGNNRDDYGPYDWNWDGLGADDVTLPRLLQEAGYRTIHVGKAHFAPFGHSGEDPLNLGFDVNIAGSSIGEPGSYLGENGYGLLGGTGSRAVPGLEKYHGTGTFLTEALTLEALAQVDSADTAKKPFFLYLSHYAVHNPFEIDQRFIAHYQDTTYSQAARGYASPWAMCWTIWKTSASRRTPLSSSWETTGPTRRWEAVTTSAHRPRSGARKAPSSKGARGFRASSPGPGRMPGTSGSASTRYCRVSSPRKSGPSWTSSPH